MPGKNLLVVGLSLIGFTSAGWSQAIPVDFFSSPTQSASPEQAGPRCLQAGAAGAVQGAKLCDEHSGNSISDDGKGSEINRDSKRALAFANETAGLVPLNLSGNTGSGAPVNETQPQIKASKHHGGLYNFFHPHARSRQSAGSDRPQSSEAKDVVPAPGVATAALEQPASQRKRPGFWARFFGLGGSEQKTVVAAQQQSVVSAKASTALPVNTENLSVPADESNPAFVPAVFNRQPEIPVLTAQAAAVDATIRRISAGLNGGSSARDDGKGRTSIDGPDATGPNGKPSTAIISPVKKSGPFSISKFGFFASAGGLTTSPSTAFGKTGHFSSKSVGITYQIAQWKKLFGLELGLYAPIKPYETHPAPIEVDKGTPVFPIPDEEGGGFGVTNSIGTIPKFKVYRLAHLKVSGPSFFGRLRPTFGIGGDLLHVDQMTINTQIVSSGNQGMPDGTLLQTLDPIQQKVAPNYRAGAAWGPGFEVDLWRGATLSADWWKNTKDGYGSRSFNSPAVTLKYTFGKKKKEPVLVQNSTQEQKPKARSATPLTGAATGSN